MTTEKFYPKDKVIIITGGAGQLGSALCKELDDLGNICIMADMDIEVCKKRISELDLKNTTPFQLDVTDINSIETTFDKIKEKFGRIDGLINNAGISVFTPFEKRTAEEFERVMKVNVFGTFFCMQKIIKLMENQDDGFIVNLGSIYGVVSPDPRIYGDSGRNSPEVYGASKAGIISMTRYMAAHTPNKNIRINCVSPGGIFNNQKEFFVQNYNQKTPKGRMADVNDIAYSIIYLCSEASTYVNGHNLIVDGGFTIW